MNLKKIKKSGPVYIIVAAFCWGWIPILSRFAYLYGSDPQTASAMRSYLAAPVFLLLLLIDGSWKRIKWKDLPFYIIYGIVAFGCTSFLYMSTVELLNSAMAAILQYTSTAFVVILNRIFYKEPITVKKLLAIILTFGGCFLVVRGYDPAYFTGNIKGILTGLCSGICFSMTTVLGVAAKKKNTGKINSGLMVIFGTLVFLVIRPPWEIKISALPEFGAYAALAVISTVFAYMLYLRGMDTGIEGGKASIISTVEPVTAAILGCLLFKDHLEILQITGIAIVLFGISLPITEKTKAKPDKKNFERKTEEENIKTKYFNFEGKRCRNNG